MKNNEKRTLIRCSIRPFDCIYSKPIYSMGEVIEHFCNTTSTKCSHAYIDIKDERREKLNKIQNNV